MFKFKFQIIFFAWMFIVYRDSVSELTLHLKVDLI